MWRWLCNAGDWVAGEVIDLLLSERGGGEEPQQPQFIQPPPPQITQLPPPNIQQNASDLYQAQLQYNPQLTAQATQLQQQYAPQLAALQSQLQQQFAPQYAQSQFDIAQQFTPQYRQLYEQSFPTQTQGLETLAQQSLQRFQSPQGLTPEQQALQDQYRQRGREQIQRSVRESANVGGTLYGGHRQEREDEALGRFEQGLLEGDLARQERARAQALQEFVTAQQVVFPQIQQPGVGMPGVAQFGQGVTPSPDALLQAILQGTIVQPAAFQPGTAGTPGFGAAFGQGLGRALPLLPFAL